MLTDIRIESGEVHDVVATFTNCGHSEEVRISHKHLDRAEAVLRVLRGAAEAEEAQGYIEG